MLICDFILLKDGQENILGLENMIHKDFIDTFVLSTNVKEHLAIPQAYTEDFKSYRDKKEI